VLVQLTMGIVFVLAACRIRSALKAKSSALNMTSMVLNMIMNGITIGSFVVLIVIQTRVEKVNSEIAAARTIDNPRGLTESNIEALSI